MAKHNDVSLTKARSAMETLLTQPEFSRDRALKASTTAPWRNGRRPDFWQDIEVRVFFTQAHRQITLSDAIALAAEKFGRDRSSSRSAVQRYWALLDQV